MATMIRAAVCAALGALAAFPVTAADSRTMVDPFEGVIGGLRAISFYPVDMSRGRPEILAPDGYTAHLVPDEDGDIEQVYPAGEWLIIDEGTYTSVWLEGPYLISPRPRTLTYSPILDDPNDPNAHGTVITDELVPAGIVALAQRAEVDKGQTLRLLSTSSHLRYSWVDSEMSRRVSKAAAHDGVLMPAGPAIAAIYDPDVHAFVAVSRPFRVEAGRVNLIAPGPPAEGFSDLMVRFTHPPMEEKARHDVKPVLITGRGPREPALVIHALNRCFAWWYGVASSQARVELDSAFVYADPVEVNLVSGKVAYTSVDLKDKPAVDVSLVLPPELEPAHASLLVTGLRHGSPLGQIRLVEPLAPTYIFDGMPLDVVRVSLSAPPWTFSKIVDLTDGRRAHVLFEPRSALVHGSVSVGGEGAPAKVGFMVKASGERYAETVTDDRGGYEILLFPEALGALTRVQVRDRLPRAPQIDFLPVPASSLRDGSAVDFNLADNAIRVTAVDAATGEAVPSAEVCASEARTNSNWQRRFVADDQGTVLLPPVPLEISLTLVARAQGYREPEPVVVQVTEDTGEEDQTLFLEPDSEGGEVILLLPDGASAAGARVAIFPAVDTLWTWEDTTDVKGSVTIPERLAGGLLAGTHERGGWLIQPWSGSRDGPVTLRFPARSEVVAAKVVTPAGDPVPYARLRVWLGERKLGNAMLAWLTHGGAAASGDGIWVCNNTPRAELQMLAWSPYDSDLDPHAQSGEYDYLRTRVGYPRARWTRVEAVLR